MSFSLEAKINMRDRSTIDGCMYFGKTVAGGGRGRVGNVDAIRFTKYKYTRGTP
jgi:hypothetical protein